MPPSVLLEVPPAGPSFRPSTSRKWLWQVGLLFSLLPLGRWSRTVAPPAVAAVPARAVPAWRALPPLSTPPGATPRAELPLLVDYLLVPLPVRSTAGL